jgi:hypothetical protein
VAGQLRRSQSAGLRKIITSQESCRITLSPRGLSMNWRRKRVCWLGLLHREQVDHARGHAAETVYRSPMSSGFVAGLSGRAVEPGMPLTTRQAGAVMGKVIAGITTSVDGYITGPDDGPGKGLGVGGERLHNWVFGGPWTYDAVPEAAATGEDQE